MPDRRQLLGASAEDLAASRLAGAGCRVVARNARVRYAELGIAGEIDLIAIDRGTLVFVEVKAGRAGARTGPQRPVLAVDSRKQRRLRRLARAWLASEEPPRFEAIRFDVIGVLFGAGAPELEWIRDAF
ncbi:MAG: YraN family protein [Solirubrobacterales bacterium]